MQITDSSIFYGVNWLIIAVFLILISNIPSILIHTQYYLENRNLSVELDNKNKVIKFNKSNSDFKEYLYSDILEIQRVSHLNEESNSIGYILSWSNYGYLRFIMNDGTSIDLTSLMLDIREPPIKHTTRNFKFLPFIPISNQSRLSAERDQINYFRNRYKDLALKEIVEITKNEKLNEFAKIAAIELIKETETNNR